MNVANLVTSVRLLSLAPLLWTISTGDKSGAWISLFWYLFAGATDVLDGFLARRFGLVSKVGAMLDLLADRLLTFCAILGLAFRGNIDALFLISGVILIGRDFLVAGLNEAFPQKLNIRVDIVEKIKVLAQFLGLGLLMSPNLKLEIIAIDTHKAGQAIFILSAILCAYTIVRYTLRAKVLPNDK